MNQTEAVCKPPPFLYILECGVSIVQKVLIATHNEGKARELKSLIQGDTWEFTTPGELNLVIKVDETGTKFEQNAVLKAKEFCFRSNLISLADDSGLEVDVLGGDPGVYSARYGGSGLTDKERNTLLIARLSHTPWDDRGARFRCVIAIASPDGELVLCKGECPGIITTEPRGENGFGYDPIFWLPEFNKTMAELNMDEKNRISHRGKAAQQAKQYLDARLTI